MRNLLFWTIQMGLLPLISPFFVGLIRKIKAKFQGRSGAGVFQPYRDLIKLLKKDETISSDASWIFRFAPYIIFSVTIVLSAGIPVLFLNSPASIFGDLLVFIYLVALGTFFLALAGMDVGSSFGGFGSSREMTVAALTEGGLVFSLLVMAFLAKTTNLTAIPAVIIIMPLTSLAPSVLAFFAFLIALLAETARFPFDNPATHLELTMIHEAMILEYSGKRLALIEWAAANKLLIFMTLGANLFFPWGLASSLNAAVIFSALAVYLIKIFIICAFIAVLESTMAKFRFFRLPDLLLTSFIIGIIALVLIL